MFEPSKKDPKLLAWCGVHIEIVLSAIDLPLNGKISDWTIRFVPFRMQFNWCLCCVCQCVIKSFEPNKFFASIFDILLEFVINITSLWLPGEKRTSLKTLTKANLTSSIEIRCHTEWIAWKTLTTVNWKLFQSVFSSLFISLIPLAPESRCFLQFKLGVCL